MQRSVGRVVGIGAVPGPAVDLGRERAVLGKRQLGVGRREAQFAILLAEFLLHLRRCQFATSTRQEVLRGEGTSRTVVAPGAVEILLREFATTDDRRDNVAD